MAPQNVEKPVSILYPILDRRFNHINLAFWTPGRRDPTFCTPLSLSFSLVFFISVTAQSETRPDSIGLRHSADPFTFREQRFQSFSARLQVYQGRFRDFLRALEPAPEALGGVLEPSWSHFGPSNEHPQYPMVKTRVQELSQSTFLKDVSNGIMVLEGPGGALITPCHPPPEFR